MMMILTMIAAAAAKSLQLCPTLCDPIDGSPPGSPVPGILQARTLGWVAISFSNAWKWKLKVKLLSCDPMDCSPPGSSVHGIFQTRVLEWGAIAFSNIHPRRTPFPIWNQSVVPCPVLTVASWPAYRFLKSRSGGLVFPSLSEFSTVYCDPHSQRLWHSQ